MMIKSILRDMRAMVRRFPPFRGIKGGLFMVALFFCSCNYLDVVPDGVAVIEKAFSTPSNAERYLYTCYLHLKKTGDAADCGSNPALTAGDEVCTLIDPYVPVIPLDGVRVAQGMLTFNNNYLGNWTARYQAIRDCNIFLENIDAVPGMDDETKKRWAAEVLTLKAFYHFQIVRQYGPAPMIRENAPLTTDVEAVKVPREPVDVCFDYIVSLLDEAIPALPLEVVNPVEEQGRLTRVAAMALKAKILVYAASPLFNGNTDQANLKNLDGTQLFDQTVQPAKWERAVTACREAIALCDEMNLKLYRYPGEPQYKQSAFTLQQMTLRSSFTEKWNPDILWANTQSLVDYNFQLLAAPKLDGSATSNQALFRKIIGTPLKIAELFYSDHGVPIEEDKTWPAASKYVLRGAVAAERLQMVVGNKTATLHFNREPRFYAWIGFDEGVWYGQRIFDDDVNSIPLFTLNAKRGGNNAVSGANFGPVSGYFIKKYIHYQNTETTSGYEVNDYPWPLLRLSDLYLLYAEALNEAADNASNRTEARRYLDLVRARAGLPTAEEAWTQWSNDATKYDRQEGLQSIIRQERLIELCFEGQRFWDLRRWKTAPAVYATPIQGWDLNQSRADMFYRPVTLYTTPFGRRDYFWPINETNLLTNKNLVQNTGW